MQKLSFKNEKQKAVNAVTITAVNHPEKNKKNLYQQGKKMADKVMNIFNYQYKDSDLEQFVF